MANSKFDSKSFNAEAFKYMVDRVPNLNLTSSRSLVPLRAILTSAACLPLRTVPRMLVWLCAV